MQHVTNKSALAVNKVRAAIRIRPSLPQEQNTTCAAICCDDQRCLELRNPKDSKEATRFR
jgi:hypothetical protein